MRTSLSELQYIENQLCQIKKDPTSKFIWEAQLLADPELKKKVDWQKRVYQVIRYFGRGELKQELNAIHKKLMTRPENISFKEKIESIFLT